ncbi:MAG: diguanylate cyclase [Cyanobium sp. CACIAM 14]|nr:MAG: diguanylate cyclase [Cyanobium sp. CACIAM 14]
MPAGEPRLAPEDQAPEDQAPKEQTPNQQSGDLLHLVGIGASAGGLEALQLLVGQLSPSGAVAYVVAQHLAPDSRSLIVDLLARATPLRVLTAVHGAELLPDTITVAPRNHDISVQGNRVVLSDPEPRFGPSPGVDRLFESIAEQWAERGAAVVLSGTGSDGARGLRAVRAAGGLTIAQEPASARFDGMPTAATVLGGADLVLEPAAIGQHLDDLAHSGGDWVGESLASAQSPDIGNIVEQLRQACGLDFSEYKVSTLQRQVQRRMAIRQIPSLEEYLKLLTLEPGESSALVSNLLVTVTAFFRDPDAFEALGGLLRRYVAERSGKGPLRVWVPGCATGEEVFSLAMLISEVLHHPRDLSHHLKIFGTDLDEDSLIVARQATYPLAAAQAVPEILRDRFVIRRNEEVVISEALRNCAVFARHNVGVDPPFASLDLISCRNTLIYFTPPLQERVFGLFHFGLLPGGLLFLGKSESLGSRTPGFMVADAEHRIYTRDTQRQRLTPAAVTFPHQRPALPPGAGGRISILREPVVEQHVATLEALVRSLCPPSLVLDANHDLVEVIGDVRPYCQLPEGRISTAFTTFLLPELQAEARALLLIVRADAQPIRSRLLHLPEFDIRVRLEARPLQVGDQRLTLLGFLPEPPDGTAPPEPIPEISRDEPYDLEIARLEKELLASQDSLRRSLADLEGANEELEASAEELQASSEELQSSNEELESSNEELRATNEELATLNLQLRARTEELQQISSDLENIQRCPNQGMVIVDRELRITRYTPLAVRVFALVERDIGQPLLGIPTTVNLPGLRAALVDVLAGAPRCSIEAENEDVAYLAQVLPYEEPEGQRRGVIITLTDVTELVALRRAAEAALDAFTTLTDALDEAVWKRDASLHRILYASRRFQPLTGWSPAELVAHPELLDDAIDPEDRERVLAGRDLTEGGWSLQYRLTSRDGRQHWVKETARLLSDGMERYVVGTLSDVTDTRTAERHSQDLAHLFETLISSPSFALAVFDGNQRVVMVNDTLCRWIGFERESLTGSPASLFCSLPQLSGLLQSDPIALGPLLVEDSFPLQHRDGSTLLSKAELWRLPAAMDPGSLLLVIPTSQMPEPETAPAPDQP